MNHLLPLLNPQINVSFAPLCVALSTMEAADLLACLVPYINHVHLALDHNEFLDVEAAQRIADVLELLLNSYAAFEISNQALICGAARYFLHADDVAPDLSSVLGFEDDIAVVNYVVQAIGRQDLRIDL